MTKKARDSWTGRIGIILAVAGSAVGLGNLLRFPSVAAANGGGAFIIPYFVALILLGLPLCWIEWTLGRFGSQIHRGDAPGIFNNLGKGNPLLKYLGVLGLIGPLGIFFYYIYIESWTLAYCYLSITGSYRGITDPAEMNRYFAAFLASPLRYVFFLITFAANLLVLLRGISGGIEKFCRISMPILLITGAVIAVKVMFLGHPVAEHPDWNVSNGFGFLWNPEFGKLKDPKVWLAAAGQIFFTLSIGMGVLMTYASYLKPRHDLTLSSTSAAFVNEAVEVIIGASIVIPAAFCFFGPVGTQTAIEGGMFGLGFRTMPLIFNYTAGGPLLSVIWFLLLFIAGITSSVSMVQPAISFIEDQLQVSKPKTVLFIGAICLVGANIAVFVNGAIDEMDFWFSSFGLPVFALIEVWIFLKCIGLDKGWNMLHEHAIIRIPIVFKYVMGFATPVALGAILLAWFFSDGWRMMLMLDTPREQYPAVITVRVLYLAVLALFLFLAAKACRGQEVK